VLVVAGKGGLKSWERCGGTVCFGNDHVAAILGFGQFCDSDLEVAFRRDACFVRNLEGVDLLKGNRSTNLYAINLHEMALHRQSASWLEPLLQSHGYGINYKGKAVCFGDCRRLLSLHVATGRSVLPVQEPQVRQTSTASTTIADIAPIPTNSSSHATNIPITSQDVDELNLNAMVDGNTFVNPFANSSISAAASSSSQNVDPSRWIGG
nr:hypothetical protein [Tanacetum cinerariifolium]